VTLIVALNVYTLTVTLLSCLERNMVGTERDHHALCVCLRAPTLLKEVMGFDKTWRELQDTPKQHFFTTCSQ
jgi:hypothetical protein